MAMGHMAWGMVMAVEAVVAEGDRLSYAVLWKANIVAFGLLIFLFAGAVIWQNRYMDRSFIQDAEHHANLAAGIIRVNARNSMLAKQALQDILSLFLRNSVNFIRFLNNIEPFDEKELSAFAMRSGLFGITILGQDGMVESSSGWLFQDPQELCARAGGADLRQGDGVDSSFLAFPERGLFLMVQGGSGAGHCIVAGVKNSRIADLFESISLKRSLEQIRDIPGIVYIKLMQDYPVATGSTALELPQLKHGPGGVYVVEVVRPLSRDYNLVMGIDARPLMERHRIGWYFFAICTGVLTAVAALLSLLLFRHQRRFLERIKSVESQLHERREEANLGRYAAAIAHEIRNPLNAVSMGIQSIIMKTNSMAKQDRQLLQVLLKELDRVARIISDLLNYARPVEMKPETVDLEKLVEDSITVVRQRFPSGQIRHRIERDGDTRVYVDPDLFSQVVSNLLLNAFEAYREGEEGLVAVQLSGNGAWVVLEIRNKGDLPRASELSAIFEPYYTEKVRGTGLGLAISRKIVKAHGGAISARISHGWFCIRVELPAAAIE